MSALRRKDVQLGLVATCLVANWGLFLVRPRLDRLRGLEAEVERLEGERERAAGLQTLLADLDHVEEELAASAPPASSSSPEGFELSALAAACGLTVEAAAPFEAATARYGDDGPAPSSASALTERLRKADPGRRLVRWSAWGDFAGLLAFLERLPSLPGEPVVLDLQVERKRDPGAPLLIRMVLAS